MDLQGVWESFLDIIYPMNIRCAICDAKKEDLLSHGICKECESRLSFIEPPVCPKCGKMMLADDKLCLDCEEADHAFYKGMSIFEFDTEVRSLIHRYKYKGEKYLAIPMIHWMTEGLKKRQWDIDIIVPVPLHLARERQRGFNQANLLAEGLSRNMGLPLMNKSLLRIKDTPHQTRLGRQERQENLTDAFQVRGRKGSPSNFVGKSILLVDDVYTTGSTAHQCAKVLLDSGASKIYVITLAIGASY